MLNIKRILVPIDFSGACTSALAYAKELAHVHRAAVEVLHVIEQPTFPAIYKMGEEAMLGETETLRDRAIDALQECIRNAGGPDLDQEPGFHILAGRPASEIVRFATEHDADLIIISSHGLSGIERIVMGTVAEKVMRDASCPVLLLKSFGKSLLPQE